MDCDFVTTGKIDSFQKLRLLLWLLQNPQRTPTAHELAEQLFVLDIVLVERMIAELAQSGFVLFKGQQCRLPDSSQVQYCLRCLQQTIEDPRGRQRLLAQIGSTTGRLSSHACGFD